MTPAIALSIANPIAANPAAAASASASAAGVGAAAAPVSLVAGDSAASSSAPDG
jgi:hypothetical protein